MGAQYDKILIFNTAFPGDIILTTPLIRAVYENLPAAHLAFCTTEPGARLLAGLSYLDSLIIYDKHGQDRGLTGLLGTVRRLRKENFDLALSTHRSIRSAALLRLARIPVRVGFAQSAAPWLYTHTVQRRPDLHETERNLSLLEALGLPLGGLSRKPFLPVTGEEANQVFGKLGVGPPPGSGPLVLVAPGSVWSTKRWLAGRFAELIDCLTACENARVVLVGSPLDRAQADEILKFCQAPLLDLVGMTGLREMAALVRKADLLVTGDSAPMHVAWALDVPTVAIFGATTPELGFAPLSGRCLVVELKNLDCRPCGEHGPVRCPLRHLRCMKEITVEMVGAACRKALEMPAHGGAPAISTDS